VRCYFGSLGRSDALGTGHKLTGHGLPPANPAVGHARIDHPNRANDRCGSPLELDIEQPPASNVGGDVRSMSRDRSEHNVPNTHPTSV